MSIEEHRVSIDRNDEGDFPIKNKPKHLSLIAPLLDKDVRMIETSHKKDSFYSRTQTEQLLICLFVSFALSRNGRTFKEQEDYYKVPLSEVIRSLKVCTPQYLDYRGWIEALEFCGFTIEPSLNEIEEFLSEKMVQVYSETGVKEMVIESPIPKGVLCRFCSDPRMKFKELRKKLGVPHEICYPY